MTDQPDNSPEAGTPHTEPAESIATETGAPAAESPPGQRPSQWERMRPRSALSQVAAALVAVAAAIFIAGAIFVAGFALGSEGGDEHHPRGDGSGHSEYEHHGDGDESAGWSDEGSRQDDSDTGGSGQQGDSDQTGQEDAGQNGSGDDDGGAHG